jgi:hypothetical protein
MTTEIELTSCIDEIIMPLRALAATYKCQFKNYIPSGIMVTTDREAFSFVINRLIRLILQSSYNSNISISHVYDQERLSISIADDNNNYNGFISGKMQKHQSIIKKAGCCLSFEFKEKKNITVILGFTARGSDFNTSMGA